MRKLLHVTLTFLALAYIFCATANAAAQATDESIVDLARQLYEILRDGGYSIAAVAAGLLFVSAVLRRFGARVVPWFATSNGGRVIVLIGSFGAMLTAALATGSAVSAALVFGALHAAFLASAGYSWIKKVLIDPLRPWMESKAPAPLRWLYLAIAWMFARIATGEKPAEAS